MQRRISRSSITILLQTETLHGLLSSVIDTTRRPHLLRIDILSYVRFHPLPVPLVGNLPMNSYTRIK
jgi:hypothetical protein